MKKLFKEKRYMLPFIFLMVLYPLIMFGKYSNLTREFYRYWGSTNTVDFFTYYKKIALIVTCVILIFMCVFRWSETVSKIKRYKSIFILSGIYGLLVIASTIFSAHKEIALKGFVESNQGMWVQLGYMVIFLSAILLIKDVEDIKIIIKSFLVGSIIMSCIALTQYMGKDIWTTSFGRWLLTITDGALAKNRDGLEFLDIVYGTVYHKDYLGSYYAIVVPLSIGMGIVTKEVKEKILYILIGLVSFVMVYLCQSRAGLGGAIFGIGMVMIVLLVRYMKKGKKSFVLGIAIVLVGLTSIAGFFTIDKGSIGVITGDVKALFEKNNDFDINEATELKEVIDEENKVGFRTDEFTFKTSVIDNKLVFLDENDKKVGYTKDDDWNIQLEGEQYKNLSIKLANAGENNVLIVKNARISFYYELTAYNVRIIDGRLVPVNYEPIEKIGFNGKEMLFTVRGYIWSRSLPLLKNNLIIGDGPDTFAANFPQHDFIGKLYGYGDMWLIVDKPHNLYLQIALDNGIFALCIFIAILLLTLIKGFKNSSVRLDELNYKRIGGMIACSMSAYLITGIINDNRISVAPLFFVMMGCCFISNEIKNDKIKMKRGN